MKKFKIVILSILFFTGIMLNPVFADDMDDLSDSDDIVSVDESDDMDMDDESGSDDEGEVEDEDSESSDDSKFSISIGGYVKGLVYFNSESYSDEVWVRYQILKGAGQTVPGEQEISGINNSGSRIQLKMEGFLSDKARFFSSLNLNFNNSSSVHSSTLVDDYSFEESQNGDVRMVETFVEIYEGSRTWKIGPQIVTWSFLEGMVVPTDRVNARDYSYKSTEYEDSKIASSGLLLTQRLWSTQLELMYIPVANTNVTMPFQDYFYLLPKKYPEHDTSNSKYAGRFSGTLGDLDFALTYVDGTDPDADIYTSGLTSGKTYYRIQSPGIDLQYNLGSFLAKFSGVYYYTEDKDSSDSLIKNNWSQYLMGVEFTAFDSTINFYAGQKNIEDYNSTDAYIETNFLIGQLRETTNSISGHINMNFLTGNALNIVFLGANHWDEDGESVQTNIKVTVKYKITDGLDILFSPSYMNLMENEFVDYQAEIKYSF